MKPPTSGSSRRVSFVSTTNLANYLEQLAATGLYGTSIGEVTRFLVQRGVTGLIQDGILPKQEPSLQTEGVVNKPDAPSLLDPPGVHLVPATREIVTLLREDLSYIYQLSAEDFELFICDRLDLMGFEVSRIGKAFAPDGGVDIIANSKEPCAFPFLLGVQAKHHRSSQRRTGPAPVRELHAVAQKLCFNAALLVTNTTFTPDARWFAEQASALLRLSDLADLRRWILDNFIDEQNWRGIPKEIVLRPGLAVRVPRSIRNE